MLLFEIQSIIINDFWLYIIFIILLFQSLCDIFNNDVYTIFNISLLLIGVITNYNHIIYYLISSLILPIILLLIKLLTNAIGGGDIEMLFCLGFIFKFNEICLILLIASILNIIYSFINKKEKYAYIPFLSVATIFIYLLNIL